MTPPARRAVAASAGESWGMAAIVGPVVTIFCRSGFTGFLLPPLPSQEEGQRQGLAAGRSYKSRGSEGRVVVRDCGFLRDGLLCGLLHGGLLCCLLGRGLLRGFLR